MERYQFRSTEETAPVTYYDADVFLEHARAHIRNVYGKQTSLDFLFAIADARTALMNEYLPLKGSITNAVLPEMRVSQ